MRYIIIMAIALFTAGCVPEGDSHAPTPDAGQSDAIPDRCGGCDVGECVDISPHGWVCAKRCGFQKCAGWYYCTDIYKDEPTHMCTEEPLLDG